jgi:predicted RNase H-like nuclease (RuvC/YqgF family)
MQINLTKANKVTLEKEISELKSHLSTAERELKKLGDDMKMADLFEDTAEKETIRTMRDNLLNEITELENQLSTKEAEYEALS